MLRAMLRNLPVVPVLPKTGQTTVYQAGDDGTYQKGYASTPRFIDLGDGTILDRATGLIWAQDGDGAGCNNGAAIAWGAAITFAEGLTFAGHDDWRLPNINELQSLVVYSLIASHVDPIFTNTTDDIYLSSTTYSHNTTYSMIVDFGNGSVSFRLKTNTYYVRLVRGGKP
jgi:hypothetical protein